jgi:hypothetical protein
MREEVALVQNKVAALSAQTAETREAFNAVTQASRRRVLETEELDDSIGAPSGGIQAARQQPDAVVNHLLEHEEPEEISGDNAVDSGEVRPCYPCGGKHPQTECTPLRAANVKPCLHYLFGPTPKLGDFQFASFYL